MDNPLDDHTGEDGYGEGHGGDDDFPNPFLEGLTEGVMVVDDDGRTGMILVMEDPHEVIVQLTATGVGVYCCDPECEGFNPIRLLHGLN